MTKKKKRKNEATLNEEKNWPSNTEMEKILYDLKKKKKGEEKERKGPMRRPLQGVASWGQG